MEPPKSTNGYCPICKRKLTTPESIARGIGPKCEKRWLEQEDGSEQLDFDALVLETAACEETVLTDEHKAINEIAAGIEQMDEEQPEIKELIANVQHSFNGMMTGQCDVKKALKAELELKKRYVTLANQVEEIERELEAIETELQEYGKEHFTAERVISMIRTALQDGANVQR